MTSSKSSESESPDRCHSLAVRCLYAQRARLAPQARQARAGHSLRALLIRRIFQLARNAHAEYALTVRCTFVVNLLTSPKCGQKLSAQRRITNFIVRLARSACVDPV